MVVRLAKSASADADCIVDGGILGIMCVFHGDFRGKRDELVGT